MPYMLRNLIQMSKVPLFHTTALTAVIYKYVGQGLIQTESTRILNPLLSEYGGKLLPWFPYRSSKKSYFKT